MIYNFNIPSFALSALSFEVVEATGIKSMAADKGLSASQATMTVANQYPTVVSPNVDTYLILKGTSTAFAAQLLYGSANSYQAATVINKQRCIIPIRYNTAGAYILPITDGIHSTDLDVTVQVRNLAAGTFSITAQHYNTLNIIGNQKMLIEGTGLVAVTEIADDEGNSLDFVVVDDENIVVTTVALTASGSHTFTLKNAASTTLGTFAATFNDYNDIELETFFFQTGDTVSLYYPNASNLTINAFAGASVYTPASFVTDLISQYNLANNAITRIVRDRDGVVCANCPYTIKSIAGNILLRDYADYNGVISLQRSLLPSSFILQLDRSDVPMKSEYIEL